jgi:hypothetical protein
MAKSQETWSKKETQKKKQQKRKEKEQKKEERKANAKEYYFYSSRSTEEVDHKERGYPDRSAPPSKCSSKYPPSGYRYILQ